MGKAARARPCRRKLHTIPAGKRGCEQCRYLLRREKRLAENQQTIGRSNFPAYLRGSFPPKDILNSAACGPEIAYLFDVRASDETRPAAARRHRAAAEVCAGCPVADACRADAYESRRMGVYGGSLFDHAFWTADGKAKAARARSGVVQVVPVVQDSTAC